MGETHFTTLAYSVLYRWTPQRRQLDYLRLLGAGAQSAKEVKIFGLGEYLSQRYGEISESIYKENRHLATRRAADITEPARWSCCRLWRAPSLWGTFIFLTGAFSRSRRFTERILTSANDISEQAMFLKDLFEFFEMQPGCGRLVVRNINFTNFTLHPVKNWR